MADEQIKEEFTDDYVPQTNWMAFDAVGEYIRGTLVETFYREGQGGMPDQQIYTLKNVDGLCERLGLNGKADDPQDTFNVGIKAANNYINSRMKSAKQGQRVGFKFEKEIPPKQKGYNPAKSIKPYVWPNFDEDFAEEKAPSEDDINVDQVPY